MLHDMDAQTRGLLVGVLVGIGAMGWGAADVGELVHDVTRWVGLGALIGCCTRLVCRHLTRETNRQEKHAELCSRRLERSLARLLAQQARAREARETIDSAVPPAPVLTVRSGGGGEN